MEVSSKELAEGGVVSRTHSSCDVVASWVGKSRGS